MRVLDLIACLGPEGGWIKDMGEELAIKFADPISPRPSVDLWGPHPRGMALLRLLALTDHYRSEGSILVLADYLKPVPVGVLHEPDAISVTPRATSRDRPRSTSSAS